MALGVTPTTGERAMNSGGRIRPKSLKFPDTIFTESKYSLTRGGEEVGPASLPDGEGERGAMDIWENHPISALRENSGQF